MGQSAMHHGSYRRTGPTSIHQFSSGPGRQSILEEEGRSPGRATATIRVLQLCLSPQLNFLPMEISQDNATPSTEP